MQMHSMNSTINCNNISVNNTVNTHLILYRTSVVTKRSCTGGNQATIIGIVMIIWPQGNLMESRSKHGITSRPTWKVATNLYKKILVKLYRNILNEINH